MAEEENGKKKEKVMAEAVKAISDEILRVTENCDQEGSCGEECAGVKDLTDALKNELTSKK